MQRSEAMIARLTFQSARPQLSNDKHLSCRSRSRLRTHMLADRTMRTHTMHTDKARTDTFHTGTR